MRITVIFMAKWNLPDLTLAGSLIRIKKWCKKKKLKQNLIIDNFVENSINF